MENKPVCYNVNSKKKRKNAKGKSMKLNFPVICSSHTRLCFCLSSTFTVTFHHGGVQRLPPGYSWSLRLVPGAMQERHLAPDMLVLIITVHSPGLLFHWHREKGQSFAGYSFIPLPCWVRAALLEAQANILKAEICQVTSTLCFCVASFIFSTWVVG